MTAEWLMPVGACLELAPEEACGSNNEPPFPTFPPQGEGAEPASSSPEDAQ